MKYLVNIVLILTVLVGISACQTTPKDDLQIVNALVSESQDAIQNKLDDTEKEEILEKLYPMLDKIDRQIDSLKVEGPSINDYERNLKSKKGKSLEELRSKVNGQIGALENSMSYVDQKYVNWNLTAEQRMEDAVREKQKEILNEIKVDSLQALLDGLPDTALTSSAFSDSLFEREAFLLNQLDSVKSLRKEAIPTEKVERQLAEKVDQEQDGPNQGPSWFKQNWVWILLTSVLVLIALLVWRFWPFVKMKITSLFSRGSSTSPGPTTASSSSFVGGIASIWLSIKTDGVWSWIWSGVGKYFLLRFIDEQVSNPWLRGIIKGIIILGLLILFIIFVVPESWKNKIFKEASLENIAWFPALWWVIGIVGIVAIATLLYRNRESLLVSFGFNLFQKKILIDLGIILLVILALWKWEAISEIVSPFSFEWNILTKIAVLVIVFLFGFWLMSKLKAGCWGVVILALLIFVGSLFIFTEYLDPLKDRITKILEKEDSKPREKEREYSPGEKEEVIDHDEIEIIPPSNPFPEETEGDQKKELLEERVIKKNQKKKLTPAEEQKRRFKKPLRRKGIGRDLAAKKDLKLLPGYAPGTSIENSKRVRRID